MVLRELSYTVGLFLILVCSLVICHVRPNVAELVSPELKEIRKRWSASDIVRDLDHIREDVQKITKMQNTGEISREESIFYFVRMHDFDDNGKLDGHELWAAMTHALGSEDTMPFDEIEKIVDDIFAYDDNNDGFITYPEFRRQLAPDLDENMGL